MRSVVELCASFTNLELLSASISFQTGSESVNNMNHFVLNMNRFGFRDYYSRTT